MRVLLNWSAISSKSCLFDCSIRVNKLISLRCLLLVHTAPCIPSSCPRVLSLTASFLSTPPPFHMHTRLLLLEKFQRHGLGTESDATHCAITTLQLHDFFVETLGHRPLVFLELDYCEGGDLRGLILSSSEGSQCVDKRGYLGDKGGSLSAAEAPSISGAGSGEGSYNDRRSSTRGEEAVRRLGSGLGLRLGLPGEQIAQLSLGLCEGLQHLHEVKLVYCAR